MDIECSCGQNVNVFFESEEIKIAWCCFCGSLHLENKKEDVFREVIPAIRAIYYLLKSKEEKRKRNEAFKEGI